MVVFWLFVHFHKWFCFLGHLFITKHGLSFLWVVCSLLQHGSVLFCFLFVDYHNMVLFSGCLFIFTNGSVLWLLVHLHKWFWSLGCLFITEHDPFFLGCLFIITTWSSFFIITSFLVLRNMNSFLNYLHSYFTG